MKNTVKNTFILFVFIFIFACSGNETSNEKKVLSFTVSDNEALINETNKTISLTVSDDLEALVPEITISSNAMINPASGITQNFTSPVTYTVSAEDGSSVDYKVTITSNIHSFTFNGKKYEIVKEKMRWNDAVDFAVNRGGYLTEINNSEEQKAIFTELDTKAGINLDQTRNEFLRGAVWIGGHDLNAEGTWIWDGDYDEQGTQFWSGGIIGLEGNPVGGLYNNWGLEPDNSRNQDMLSISLENTPRNGRSQWNDLDGDRNFLFFVIEYN